MRSLCRRIAYLVKRRRLETELSEELEFHRAMTQERLEREGAPAADVIPASRRALGNVTLAREDARLVWIPRWLEHAQQDARYAFRMMGKHPMFAAALVFLMAIGIGTTTTVFSLVNSLVLKPLPVHEPERLVWFGSPSFSYPIYDEVRARSAQMFSSVAAWDIEDLHVDWGGGLERGQVLLASGNFHATLGVTATLGRTLTEADDAESGARSERAAVISHAGWQRRFGGNPAALGTTIWVERVPFTIVGVTPRGFFGVAPGLAPEVTVPVTAMVQIRSEPGVLRSRSSSWLHLIARLHPDVSLTQANAALTTVWPAVLDATFPPGMDRREHFLSRTTRLEPGRSGFSRVRRQFADPLWMLFALVLLLLLVACASAANLLLARTIARRREIATRLAIGAARSRIVRQLLTESALWVALGAAGALLVTRWAGEGVVAMLATRVEPVALDLTPDWRIFAFTSALTVAALALVALLPALRASRLDPAPALKQNGQISGVRLRRWTAGKLLVAAEVALTVVLLAGAALFVRSLLRVLAEDAGFERDHLLVVSTDPIAAGYRDLRVTSFYDALATRLERIPGVESVALSLYPPISDEDGAWTANIDVDGAPVPSSGGQVYFNVVSQRFFETLGMRVLRGRSFTDAESPGAERTVVVNSTLAARLFAGGQAVGRRITIGRDPSRQNLTIVGVVQDAKYQTLQEPPRSIAYVPASQARQRLAGENLFATVRAPAALQSTGETIRRAIVSMDGGVPVHVERVADRIRDSLVRERTMANIAAVLGAAALLLACAAVYGLMAYAVSNRTAEIGIRLAFGASRASVLWMVLRDSLVLGAIGIAAGLTATLLLGGFARSLLYQITPTDPVSHAAAAAAALIVTAGAGLLPANRAAHMDPVAALRE